ncbi:MAG: S1C family serine protease [candidate division KSB1 bacterium]|nr:S1C family serine protease [candidate division KSB1 bacterium]
MVVEPTLTLCWLRSASGRRSALPKSTRPHAMWQAGLGVILLCCHAGGVQGQSLLSALESEIAGIVTSAKPSVVTITALKAPSDGGSRLLEMFADRRAAAKELVVGSGLIISSDGFVLTKESVVRAADYIDVAMDDGATYRAELVRADSARGIAIVKIHATGLKPARIGLASDLRAGSWVTVIGNALGVPQAVSVGVVRAIQADGSLHITANVDPGSNGSPVFDAQGRAVGMVAGRVGIDAANAQNGNFFSNTALVYALSALLPAVRTAAEQYYATHGWLGITVVTDGGQTWPRILTIVPDGPAQHAGLQVGDLIRKFAGQMVDSLTSLSTLVAATPPGEEVELEVVRQEKSFRVKVRLGTRIPIALSELRLPAAESTVETESGLQPGESARPEPAWLRQRLNALEKELRALKNLYQKNN